MENVRHVLLTAKNAKTNILVLYAKKEPLNIQEKPTNKVLKLYVLMNAHKDSTATKEFAKIAQ